VYPSRDGWWMLHSIPEVQSNELNDHLRWLLARLKPVAERLRGIAGPRARAECFLQIDAVRPYLLTSEAFSRAVLLRLAALCNRVELRHWEDDFA
jgi:hypothetical protein